jgi:hypothetical protein
VDWILRLVKTGAGGDDPGTDVMEIAKLGDLRDIANLGLSLAEAKEMLGAIQREVVAAQARDHAARRPSCRSCGGACHVKDYRQHRIATLFGQVSVRLPRFRCIACDGIESGVDWPSHCKSTLELDRLQAHLSALMTYRTAADVLEQLFPIDAGNDHETLRRHTLALGEQLRQRPVIAPATPSAAISISVDSTFIRGREEGGPLRAKDDETLTPRKFSLEGAEGSSRPCPWFTHPSLPPRVPRRTEAAGRRSSRHPRRRHPNYRLARVAGPSPRRTSCASSPMPIAPLKPAVSAPFCAARGSTPLPSPTGGGNATPGPSVR